MAFLDYIALWKTVITSNIKKNSIKFIKNRALFSGKNKSISFIKSQ